MAFVRLVDDNCVLLPGGAMTLDLILGQLRDGMVKEGIAQELVAAFEATLQSDIEVMDDHPELKKAPVRQMLHISQSVSALFGHVWMSQTLLQSGSVGLQRGSESLKRGRGGLKSWKGRGSRGLTWPLAVKRSECDLD